MSKANQKFVQADEAVSPVIGVILMVAITVVLAAVVFVLVSNLSKTSNKAPDVSFTTDETADRIIMVKGATGLEWDDFQIKGTTPGTVSLDLNEDAGTPDNNAAMVQVNLANTYQTLGITSTSADVFNAGDFLDFCGTSTITGVTTIQILHTESNTVVYESQFNGIIQCVNL